MYLTHDKTGIVVPWRQDLANVIPHAREFNHEGTRYLLMPNGRDEARLARNLGVPVPAPILTRYDWLGQRPWDIQRTTAALLTENPRAYVLNSIGTGKTRASLWAADWLLKQGRAKRVLIACTLSTMSLVWESELFFLLPKARVQLLHGTRAKRIERLRADAEWYVINHHGLPLLQTELIAKQFDIVILDELATSFRNTQAELWKAGRKIITECGAKFVWGMTGSPRPKAPTDCWGQMRLLTPERTTKTMTRFRDLTMTQVANFKWVERQEANEIIHEQMQPAVRFSLNDVMELPPTVYMERKVELEPLAAKAYKTMFDKLRMMSDKGEITAANEGVLQSKLLQVACGYMYTDNKKVYTLPTKPRLDAMRDLIYETDRKVIVFVPFVHALKGVFELLTKEGFDCAMVYGDTPKGARDRIFSNFQTKQTPRVLVAHPQCMAHGLTLTAANTIIWYTATNNPEHYEQANGRIVRPGQTSKTLIVHMSGTLVERVSFKRLESRGKMQGMLLDLFHQQELEI
jgi:SNF2 family DNA or RNA helicase